MNTIFFRLLAHEDKGAALLESVAGVNAGDTDAPNSHMTDPQSFRQIPGSPFAYWVSDNMRRKFAGLPAFESKDREVRVGDHPGDGFRFLRVWWEIDLGSTSLDWRPYQKGGLYSPYYADIHLVADWDADRQTYRGFYGRPGRSSERPSNYQYFFRAGLTWPRRTTSGISVRMLPRGCIFADKGPAAFASTPQLHSLLALMNSAAFEALVALQLGAADVAARSYEVGIVQTTPLPNADSPNSRQLSALAMESVDLKRTLDTATGNSHAFVTAALLQVKGDTLAECGAAWQARVAEAEQALAANQAEIDEIAYRLYGISDEDRQAIEMSLHRPSDLKPEAKDKADVHHDEEDKVDIEEEVDDKEESGGDSSYLVAGLLSYAVGCAYGRWDVRIGLDRSLAPKLADPFAPLPVCSPGMLVGPDGLPASANGIVSDKWMRARPDAITLPPDGSVAHPTIPDDRYPLSIPWEGILVDDPDHQDDLVRRVRSVLDLLFGSRAEAIEREACAVLGVKELRDYFRNPKAFFDYHVKAYSKSRRKAPIYWLLQSSRRSYGLWLYYHRLDSDLLFQVLVNYVEPKLRLEESRLDQLRAQRSEAGASGSAARGLERAIDRQEALLSELHDFRDRLDRAANLHLSPDLDDGVVLNIAPLRELVPWKVARDYWEELQKGRYEWSSVSKQLRARGVI